jgi:hypothetical protein
VTFTDLFVAAVKGGHEVLYVSPDAWHEAELGEACRRYPSFRDVGKLRLTFMGPHGPVRLVMRTPLDVPYRGETYGEKLRRRMYAVRS